MVNVSSYCQCFFGIIYVLFLSLLNQNAHTTGNTVIFNYPMQLLDHCICWAINHLRIYLSIKFLEPPSQINTRLENKTARPQQKLEKTTDLKQILGNSRCVFVKTRFICVGQDDWSTVQLKRSIMSPIFATSQLGPQSYSFQKVLDMT